MQKNESGNMPDDGTVKIETKLTWLKDQLESMAKSFLSDSVVAETKKREENLPVALIVFEVKFEVCLR